MGIIKQIIGKKESIYYHLPQGYYSLRANVINLTSVRLITLAMWYIGPEEPVPLTPCHSAPYYYIWTETSPNRIFESIE